MSTRRELKKNWFMDLTVCPRDEKDPRSDDRKVTVIRREWRGITRTEFLSYALTLCKRSLKRSLAKHPRIFDFFGYGTATKNGSLTTMIRLRNSFRTTKEFKGVDDPFTCFVIGISIRADNQVKK